MGILTKLIGGAGGVILLGRIHLSTTPAGLLVVRDLDRKPDLLEEWKAERSAWRVERWAS